MRKLGLAALVAIMVLGAVLVRAEDRKCFDKKDLVGAWRGYLAKDLLEEEGDAEGVEMEIQASGAFSAKAYGQKEPYLFEVAMTGTWKLECTEVVSQTSAIEKLEVFVDEELNLSDEEFAAAEKRIPEFSQGIRDAIMQNPEFRKERKESLVYVDAHFMITKDEDQKLYLYGKKK